MTASAADDDRLYPTRPWVGVGAVVWRGDAVLLVQRGKPPKAAEWTLPGGAQELGETVAMTAVREVAEETGVVIAPGPVVDVFDLIDPDGDGRPRYHYTLIDILAEWRSGEAVAAADAAAVRWVALQELSSMVLSEDTRRVILRAHALRG